MKNIFIIGSGFSSISASSYLAKKGYNVTVFEKNNKVGGLLRYGIPDFKMEKHVIDRRLSILEEEGIKFHTNIEVGVDLSCDELNDYDSVVLCGGATIKRNLPIKGSDLDGVKQAMEFLTLQNEVVDGIKKTTESLNAKGKNVIVIGGGDTGSDCIGTSNRQEAKSVTNFEIMPKPSSERSEEHPWPYWPF